jgi:hypothetical protein
MAMQGVYAYTATPLPVSGEQQAVKGLAGLLGYD